MADPNDSFYSFTGDQWGQMDDPDLLDFIPLSNELPISTKEIQRAYMPLVRLILEQVQSAAKSELDAPTNGLSENPKPFILGVAGSVAVGKSSTAKIIKALLEVMSFGLVVDVAPINRASTLKMKSEGSIGAQITPTCNPTRCVKIALNFSDLEISHVNPTCAVQ